MAQNAHQWLLAPVLYLDTIDSTNNYAMQLIDADKAQPGTTITALVQTHGKGQRGKNWADSRGKSLLMSLIALPQYRLDEQFLFSASVAVAVAKVLQRSFQSWQVQIKWPNDIIVNDKKAGGILIENVLRGSNWLYSVIGFGVNVLQDDLGEDLPFATSLKRESGLFFDLKDLLKQVRESMIAHIIEARPANEVMSEYNAYLLRKDNAQILIRNGNEEVFIIREVLSNGQLSVLDEDGKTICFRHGEVEWKWG